MKQFAAGVMLLLAAIASAQNSADQKQLNALTANMQAAKATFKRSKGSPQAKHALVVSIDRLATATMTSEVLSPRLRYPQALGLYQEALNLEPNNNEAKNNAAMIDGVYKGMIAHARANMKTDPKAAAEYARLTAVYKKIHRPIP